MQTSYFPAPLYLQNTFLVLRVFAKHRNPKTSLLKLSVFRIQASYMAQLPYIIMAVDAFAAGILCLLLPETNKTPTAETLDGIDSHASPALLADGNDDVDEQEKMTVV